MSTNENLFCEKCGTKIDDFEADVCSGQCFDCYASHLPIIKDFEERKTYYQADFQKEKVLSMFCFFIKH